MIRYIDSIEQYSSVSLPDGSSIKRFQRIDFEIDAIAKGGFGGVHRVESIDDSVPGLKMVLKIIPVEGNGLVGSQSLKTIRLLHDKIRRHESKSKRPFFQDYPELIGVPLVAFSGKETIAEKTFTCLLMLDLKAIGYRDLGKDSNIIKLNQESNILDRIYLSYQFFRAIDWMHMNDFNHADLHLSALFLQDIQLRLALIDYDGGYHFNHQQSPLSFGKLGYWSAHLFNQLRTVVSFKKELSILDRLQDEYFTAAAAFFELMFEVPPYFFLDSGEGVKEEYMKKYKWPELDFAEPYANESSKSLHDNLLRNLQALEVNGVAELVNGFKTVFGKGYFDGKNRLTTARWKRLTKKILDEAGFAPVVHSFMLDKKIVRSASEEVALHWNVARADRILINGNHVNFAEGVEKFTPGGERTYTLEVANDFSNFILDVAVVAEKIDPIITNFRTNVSIRDSLEPVVITWETEHADHVYLNQEKLEYKGEHKVNPLEGTTYRLAAIGRFGQQIEQEIRVEVISPQILFFSYEVNLEYGIKNVDLIFEVENCESIYISPKIGWIKANQRVVHIEIDERTEFTLLAKGLFQDTSESLTAIPFPIPSVLQISPPHPCIEIYTQLNPEVVHSHLNTSFIEIHLPLLESLNPIIDFNSEAMENIVNLPDFTHLQLQPKEEAMRILRFSDALSSFRSIYQKHFEKIN